jgi:hypothetical protein|nr:MAG TPA: hypothetical protein [Caudoviricetes sp.]
MIVSGARGIMFNPEMVYAIEKSDGIYDIVAESNNKAITLYENVSKANIENIMRRLTFQIECQVFKDED